MKPPANLPRRAFSEFLGTFALVFAGTGAIVVNQTTGGAVSHAGIALTFGLTVLAMIYTFGDISGAHFNPAVTLGFVAARRMVPRDAPAYMFSQCGGAIAASATLRFLFPANGSLGTTVPAGNALQAFVFEVIMTSMLMLVILSVSTGAKEKGVTAGIAIGAVIALEALCGGPISGASMNPARSIGPALVSGNLSALWIYLTAPVLGAMLGVGACFCVRDRGCCDPFPTLARRAKS